MAKFGTSFIIGIVISALLIGLLLPISLNGLLAFESDNSTLQTLITNVLPIIAVVALFMLFIPKSES
jgi:ABC-type proline/glycine betaine transport system permease subunit